MKVSLFSNCQGQGLQIFLKRALPSWDIICFPHLAFHFGEFTPEFMAEEHWKADLVFFHHWEGDEQNYPTKQPKIPLSVWYQSAPFMAWVPDAMWDEFKASGGTPEEAIHRDFNYQQRWDECHNRMMEKEENEMVPKDIRISDLMQLGREHQLQLTCNHPTSLVFLYWSNRILEFLGEKKWSGYNFQDCVMNPNLAGLPCEQSATSGARNTLSLNWGGRPEDDQSGLEIAREKLK